MRKLLLITGLLLVAFLIVGQIESGTGNSANLDQAITHSLGQQGAIFACYDWKQDRGGSAGRTELLFDATKTSDMAAANDARWTPLKQDLTDFKNSPASGVAAQITTLCKAVPTHD